jgi:hypothetical protein
MAGIVEKLQQMRAEANPTMGGSQPVMPTPEEMIAGESAEEQPEETSKKGLASSQKMIAEQAKSGELADKSITHDGSEAVTLSKQDHPELAEDVEGNRVVFVVGGTVKTADENSVSVSVDEVSVVHGGKPPLGTGERFSNLTEKLRKKGSQDPEALAAWIGRKNLGKERFQKLSEAGRKRNSQEG